VPGLRLRFRGAPEFVQRSPPDDCGRSDELPVSAVRPTALSDRHGAVGSATSRSRFPCGTRCLHQCGKCVLSAPTGDRARSRARTAGGRARGFKSAPARWREFGDAASRSRSAPRTARLRALCRGVSGQKAKARSGTRPSLMPPHRGTIRKWAGVLLGLPEADRHLSRGPVKGRPAPQPLFEFSERAQAARDRTSSS